jgi:hypothetical protein
MVKKIVCPRCKLPYEGINECEYCGLVFDKKTRLKAKRFKSKIKERQQVKNTERSHPNIKGRKLLILLIAIAALGFLLITYVPMGF